MKYKPKLGDRVLLRYSVRNETIPLKINYIDKSVIGNKIKSTYHFIRYADKRVYTQYEI